MRHRLLNPEILELVEGQRAADLEQVVRDLHPHDAAEMLAGLERPALIAALALLPIELERDLFDYFDAEARLAIATDSGPERLKQLLAVLASDDRAEFIDELPEDLAARLMPLLTRAVREDLIRRDRFEDDQVGAILSTEFSVLDPKLTAAAALREIRRQAPTRETIYYSFVVDPEQRLVGFVSLRRLIMAADEELVATLMNKQVVCVQATDLQEDAARTIREYDLLAVPVIDESGRLLGIFTHDDAADVQEEAAEEDLELMAGIAGEDDAEGYLDAAVLAQVRRRVPVLTVLAVSFVAISSVVQHFEDQARGVVYALLPMILATGGNVGNQASTAVILGLRHELTPAAVGQVLWKELRISICIAAVLSAIAACEAYLLWQGHSAGDMATPLHTSAAVGLAMALHVVTAAVLGALIPLGVAGVGRDPSMVAHPALATLADLSGALIYFATITALL